MKKVIILITTLVFIPIVFAQEVCNPMSIPDYTWRGICLVLNVILGHPMTLAIIVIVVMLAEIIYKLFR